MRAAVERAVHFHRVDKGTFVKICGITRLGDARAAVRAGTNAIGFVFAPSPRRIPPSAAKDIVSRIHPTVLKIGVFVGSPPAHILKIIDQVGLDGVQLHGAERPETVNELRAALPELFIAKAVRVRGPASLALGRHDGVDAIIVDPKDPLEPGASSRPIPIGWLRGASIERVVVAGGLTPENVGRLVRQIHPWGVDVSAGVEASAGRKDLEKLRAFVRAVRQAEVA